MVTEKEIYRIFTIRNEEIIKTFHYKKFDLTRNKDSNGVNEEIIIGYTDFGTVKGH